MDEEELLSLLPLKKTWLDDIVEVFLKRPHGEAEVDAIVTALLKSDRNVGAEAESTVTRTINNFCINAGDTDNKSRHPIFERIDPAKYRLLGFPAKPDLIEIQKIQFSDPAYQHLWEHFTRLAKKNPKWETMSQRKKLAALSKNVLESEQWRSFLDAHKNE